MVTTDILLPTCNRLASLVMTLGGVAAQTTRDMRVIVADQSDHPVEDEDGDAINGTHIAQLCANDWGLWRTFTANLDSLNDHLGRYELPDEDKGRITERIQKLQARIEEEPKSFGWKMRAKIGERKRWYDLPEEVEGGP